MIPAFVLAAVISAGAQDVVRAEAPNAAARPATLIAWEWPDCTRVLSRERDTFAEAMCRAAASRRRFQSATDVLDAGAARHRGEAIDHLRHALTLASSNVEKRAALSELAATYSVVRDDAALAEAVWREAIALEPDNAVGYLGLARAQELRGARSDEESTLLGARQALPRNVEVVEALARFYLVSNRIDDSIAALRDFAEQDPQDAKRHWRLAAWYWQQSLPAFEPRAAEFTASGLKAIDRALLLQPDDVEILGCKHRLLRRQAELSTDRAARDSALAAAREIRTRILELQKR